jgi:predicted transcriptional regulator of viral defense system
MGHLGLRYYVGLLSAAQYHGAAHHRPQEFQVFVARNRHPIRCGSVRVAFLARKDIDAISVQTFNTPRGTIVVSTPEATAVDIVGYHHHAGGISAVATLLAELGEKIDPLHLAEAAKHAPIPWAQRLGYLLEEAGHANLTNPLALYVHERARDYAQLLPSGTPGSPPRSKRWKLIINAEVEVET